MYMYAFGLAQHSMAAHDAAASSLHHITPAPSAARQAEEEVPTVGMRSRRRRRRGSAAGSVASSAASVAASMTWSQASGDSYQARHQAARAAALAKALAAQRPFAVDNDTPVLSRSAQTFLRQTSARESAKADEEVRHTHTAPQQVDRVAPSLMHGHDCDGCREPS